MRAKVRELGGDLACKCGIQNAMSFQNFVWGAIKTPPRWRFAGAWATEAANNQPI